MPCQVDRTTVTLTAVTGSVGILRGHRSSHAERPPVCRTGPGTTARSITAQTWAAVDARCVIIIRKDNVAGSEQWLCSREVGREKGHGKVARWHARPPPTLPPGRVAGGSVTGKQERRKRLGQWCQAAGQHSLRAKRASPSSVSRLLRRFLPSFLIRRERARAASPPWRRASPRGTPTSTRF
ncbi:hypothetical protein MRX96_000640 [Rhipicephalus microplus]